MTFAHLHPMIIHFPIALILVGFGAEILALFYKKALFSKIAFYLLLLGSLGAIAAYISGGYAADSIEAGKLAEAVEVHEDAALITLCLAITTALYRVTLLFLKYSRSWTRWVGVFLFAGLTGSVVYTGSLGGELVYEYGAGVEIEQHLPNTTLR